MTIEINVPSADLIHQVETATIETHDSEILAIATVREKFCGFAKHNGYVRIASYSRYHAGQRISIDMDRYYEADGHKVRALLACDCFDSDRPDQNSTKYSGDRLYLTQYGEWLRIERSGGASAWEGSPNQWGCGVSALDEEEDDYRNRAPRGSIRIVTDAAVAEEYDLEDIMKQLGKSLAEMSKKLPERLTKLRQRTALAAAVAEQLAKQER